MCYELIALPVYYDCVYMVCSVAWRAPLSVCYELHYLCTTTVYMVCVSTVLLCVRVKTKERTPHEIGVAAILNLVFVLKNC